MLDHRAHKLTIDHDFLCHQWLAASIFSTLFSWIRRQRSATSEVTVQLCLQYSKSVVQGLEHHIGMLSYNNPRMHFINCFLTEGRAGNKRNIHSYQNR